MSRTRVTRDLDAIPEMEWVRLAAFIDGEGCIRIASGSAPTKGKGTHRTYRHYVEVIIANTDVRLPEWLVRVFGGYVHTSRQKSKSWKPSYHWRVSCAYACKILQHSKPFLILKKEQADVALSIQRTMIRVGVKGHSSEMIDEKQRLTNRMHELNARGPQIVSDLIN